MYGLKTKDQLLTALKKRYGYIAPLTVNNKLVTLMRDNAGENRSQEVEDLIQSLHVQSRYSTPYEHWQDGQAETAIRTLARLVRLMKAESGLSVRSWFHMIVAVANASNVTSKKRLGSTPYRTAYGEILSHREKKNVSKPRAF